MAAETPRVFVTRRLQQEVLDRLAALYRVDLWDSDMPPDYDSLRERAALADGVLCLLTDRIDAALLEAAPSLRVVSNMAVGTDNIDLAAATAGGIPVGNTPGVLTETTADYAFALLTSAARRIVEADAYVRAGQWQTWGPSVLLGRDLYGATLGIVGFGAIGQAVARRAQGFSMRVLYTRRSNAPAPPDLNAEPAELDRLLRESDFVSLHVPLTAETRHIIGERELALMKETAILVNTARGGVVDQDALVAALRRGRPAMAALDVTAVEPIDARDELLSLPNAVVTPHIASASVATRLLMANMAADNLAAGLEGSRLPNCANPDVYG
ncbi:MAG: D-glycerate dehydrogenase [Chloroflexota bacterium]|nr:D-glycerate dehydrogenase [Chloroflexota bacterium]MDE2942497.1 D-glycerate dehydrogenase [Chloroflexota bacterium]MDE3267823.1 D-glycerate dehydrogenase [Chloroflexota bacterium]